MLGDRRIDVEILSSQPLLTVAPTDYPSTNPTLQVLPAGQSVQVLRLRYGKDFRALKIKTERGEVGWLLDGPGLRISLPGHPD